MATTDAAPITDQVLKLDPVKELKLPTAVLALDATPDGQHLFAACLDGGIYEVDVSLEKHEQIGQHQSYASGVCYLKKSHQLISAGYDGMLQWHDPAARRLIRKVEAHRFWSWQLAASPNERWVASVTGQYLAGGYEYQPAAEKEAGVKVFDAATGQLRHSFSHIPPVLSAAFSPDSRFLAAGNMMGEVKIWDLEDGNQVAAWTTPDFTSWGIIKSHHYVGGIFAMTFAPDGEELLLCGMGPMRDPMAGNGKQTWQRFAWRENPARKTREINDAERGNGLMEALEFHPSRNLFVMGGRLAQGKWNTALFEGDSGKLLESADTKMRVTDTAFNEAGTRLCLSGAVSQQRKKEGQYPEFGRIKIFELGSAA